jgi:hypothetical protein
VRREWLALFAIVLTLGRGAIREVEKSAAREIRQRIGDGAFTVKLEPDGVDGLAQGRLKTLTVARTRLHAERAAVHFGARTPPLRAHQAVHHAA